MGTYPYLAVYILTEGADIEELRAFISYPGDTSVFGDMRLIGEMYRPTLAFLPIGDLFTMGPEQAAVACDLLGVKQVIPMHWGTFPLLTGTPARLRELVAGKGIDVVDLKPGDTTE